MGISLRRACALLAVLPLAACWLTSSLTGLAADAGSDGGPLPGDETRSDATTDSSASGDSSAGADATREAGVPADATDDASVPTDAPGPPCATYVQAVLCDHPVAYYRLNEPSGPVAYDTSGNDAGPFNGLYMSVTFDAGRAIVNDPTSGAAGFNGTSSVVTVDAGTLLFLGTQAFSVEAWIYPASLDTEYRGILSADNQSNGTAGPRYGYSFDITARDAEVVTANFERWGGTMSDPLSATTPITKGSWFHLVGTFDPTQSAALLLYVNGAPVGSYTGPTVTIADAGEAFVIGALFGDDTSYPSTFAGSISEVALYEQALDAGSIVKHFTASGRDQ
jgi:hypothetical protein